MSRWNKLLTLFAVIALTFVIIDLNAPQSHGAGSAPVTVVNTPLPVAITGSTTISGTVNAVQSGAWNVGITGTPVVNVTNTNTSPLFVRDVDNPAQQPFAFALCAPSSPAGPCPSSSFTIPSTTATGQPVQRFVIEYVSGACGLGIGSFFEELVIDSTFNGANGAYGVIPTLTGSSFSLNEYIIAQQMRGYADGGTAVLLDATETTGPGVAQCNLTVSGYLVTK